MVRSALDAGRVTAAMLAAVCLLLGGCAGQTFRAADLGFYEPEPGRDWCDVLTDEQVGRLAASSGGSGPWQAPRSPGSPGTDAWSCMIVPDLDGSDGTGETGVSLLDLGSRLYPPRTRAVVAAGNYSPVDAGLEGELLAQGGGLHTAEQLGMYVVRRPCDRRWDAGVPDDLEMRLSFHSPARLPHEEAVEVVQRAWDVAASTYRCLGVRPGSRSRAGTPTP